MSRDEQAWQTSTAHSFSQLSAAIWQYLAPLLGAAATREIMRLSTDAIQDTYPFLRRLVWQPQGLDEASVSQAMAHEAPAHVQAGCEHFLQEVNFLVRTCGGRALAQQLQTVSEPLRRTLDPAAGFVSVDGDQTLATLPADSHEAAMPVLQSMAQQTLHLYRQLQQQHAALAQAPADVAAHPSTIPPLPVDAQATAPIPAETAREETFYHDLFDLSPDAVVVTSTDGDILQANFQCAEILEFDTPAELIGRKAAEFLVHPEQRDTFLERIAYQHRIEGQRRELRTRRGRTIVVVVSSRLIEYEGRSCFLSVIRDVTERARLRQEMEDFAYSASHDLQAPLRTFEGYARWLLEDYGEVLDDMGQQLCEEIIDDALHMKKLLDGLLEYSRIGRLHTEAVAVAVTQVLERVQHDLQLEIADTGASITLPETLPTVFYPEVRLEQIFSNLLSNALKFTAECVPEITIGYEELTRHYRFDVQDNGIGIAPEHYGRIFEIFKRLHTREDYPGTGAGLTIVKKIVESHGGQIGVESVPGEGSTFWFTIPKTEEPQ